MKCVISGCIINCSRHIYSVFNNMIKISGLFDEYQIIFYYDHSHDSTLTKLRNIENSNKNVTIIINNDNMFPHRTLNIAKGRNSIINKIRENYNDYNFFIMMDCDNVCSKELNINLLKKYLLDERWDSLSFNRKTYYDFWALCIEPYVYNYWNMSDMNRKKLETDFKQKLNSLINTDELLEVLSAFNGFAIYRTNKFINCTYDGNERLDLIPEDILCKSIKNLDQLNSNMQTDCEHKSFHLEGKFKYNSKNMISPYRLFSSE